MKPDKIVVGLGNPGARYHGTRHNAGYMVLSELAARFSAGKPKRQFQGEVLEIPVGTTGSLRGTGSSGKGKSGSLGADLVVGANLLLLCPLTYMNLSGQSAAAALRFFKLNPEDLLVVCDDMDLPVGKIRIRDSGSGGGQKGLRDIISRLGTETVPRLRLGIGRPPDGVDPAEYVLSEFRPGEKSEFGSAVERAADAVLLWSEKGTAAAMNRFNG